jgi:hypothetical protein
MDWNFGRAQLLGYRPFDAKKNFAWQLNALVAWFNVTQVCLCEDPAKWCNKSSR